MLHVLHVDIAKADLEVALLHLLQVFYLNVPRSTREGFLDERGWLIAVIPGDDCG